MARSLFAIVTLALVAGALAAPLFTFEKNHFFKGAVTVTTSDKVEKPATGDVYYTADGLYTYTVSDTEDAEPVTQVAMTYVAAEEKVVTLALGEKVETSDVLAVDPSKKVALIKSVGEADAKVLKLIVDGSEPIVIAPAEDVEYTFDNVYMPTLVVLENGYYVILATDATAMNTKVIAHVAADGTVSIIVKEVPVGSCTYKGYSYMKDDKSYIMGYDSEFFTVVDKEADGTLVETYDFTELAEIAQLMKTNENIFAPKFTLEAGVSLETMPVVTAGALTCLPGSMKQIEGHTFGVCYESKDVAGIYEVAITGDVKDLTNVATAALRQSAVLAGIVPSTYLTGDHEEEDVTKVYYVKYTGSVAAGTIDAPEFKETIAVKQQGKSFVVKEEFDCENPIVTSSGIYCVSMKAGTLESCTNTAFEIELKDSAAEKTTTTTICMTHIVSVDQNSIIYSRTTEGKIQFYKRAHGSETEETLGSEIDTTDVDLTGLAVRYHSAEQKFVIGSKTGKIVVLNYGAGFAREDNAAAVSAIKDKIFVVNTADLPEMKYIALEPTHDYFKTKDSVLPTEATTYNTQFAMQSFLSIMQKMHEQKQLVLAPSAENAVYANDREFTVVISDANTPADSVIANTKFETVTGEGEQEVTKINFIGMKQDQANKTFELVDSALTFDALKEDSGAKKFKIVSGTGCYIRFEKETANAVEISYQLCGSGSGPAPGPAPGKLSAGAIAGIVIACVVVVALVAVLVWFFVFKKK